MENKFADLLLIREILSFILENPQEQCIKDVQKYPYNRNFMIRMNHVFCTLNGEFIISTFERNVCSNRILFKDCMEQHIGIV